MYAPFSVGCMHNSELRTNDMLISYRTNAFPREVDYALKKHSMMLYK